MNDDDLGRFLFPESGRPVLPISEGMHRENVDELRRLRTELQGLRSDIRALVEALGLLKREAENIDTTAVRGIAPEEVHPP